MAFDSGIMLPSMNFVPPTFTEQQAQEFKSTMEEYSRKKREEQQKQVDAQAEEYVSKSQLAPEQLAMMKQLQQKSEGQNLMAYQMEKKAQEDAARQMKAMAFARGYNPMAARGAMYKTAEARSNIAAQANIQAEQEKAQALLDYSSMKQYQQQMAFSGEQAKKNFLLGKQELVQQEEASMRNYQSALQELEARRKAAQQQRESQLYSALISGVATVGATVATSNPYAGMAAGQAANLIYQGTR